MLNKYILKNLLRVKWYFFTLIPIYLLFQPDLSEYIGKFDTYFLISFYFLYYISIIYNLRMKLKIKSIVSNITQSINIFFYFMFLIAFIHEELDYIYRDFGNSLYFENLEMYLAIILFLLIFVLNPLITSHFYLKVKRIPLNAINSLNYYLIFLFFIFTFWKIVPEINKIFKE